MKNGFLKVAVSTPDLKVADCQYNKEQLVKKTREMDKKGVKLLAFRVIMTDTPAATCFCKTHCCAAPKRRFLRLHRRQRKWKLLPFSVCR